MSSCVPKLHFAPYLVFVTLKDSTGTKCVTLKRLDRTHRDIFLRDYDNSSIISHNFNPIMKIHNSYIDSHIHFFPEFLSP